MTHPDSKRLRPPVFTRARFCVLLTIFVVILHVMVAAPSAAAQIAPPQYLFVSTTVPNGSGSNVPGIVTFTVNTSTGQLTQITPPPVQTRAQTGPLAINNAGTFLFGAGTNSAAQGSVEAFSVGSDGSLTDVGTSPYTVSNPLAIPTTLAVSPNGAFLYVASTVSPNGSGGAPETTILDVFAIAADGSLVLNNTFTYSAFEACDPANQASLMPVQLFVHPTQKWLYLFTGSIYSVPCSGQPSEVQPFTINSDGTLAPGTLDILPLYATAGYALTGSPDGSMLFLMTKQNPQNGVIYSSGIEPSTGGISFALAYSNIDNGPPVLSTGGLAVDSTSTYLYSSAGTFSLQDGSLTALDSSTSPYINGASLLASPSLPLIFAQDAGQQENMLLSDLINSDGSLTPAPGSSRTLGTSGAVLSGATPIPTKPVMWVQPDGPISITGITVGQTGTARLGISNHGFGALTITSATVIGDPSLTQTNTCTAASLAPGASCQVTVNFAPTSADTFTGTLTIESNTPTRSFAITATSQSPAPYPILLPTQQVLLPDAAVGSSSSITVQLGNQSTATAALTVSGVTWAGSNPADFSETNNCTSPIAPGNSCSIDITFTPAALGGRAALLNIATNGGVAQGSVSGTGVTTVAKFNFSVSVVGPGTITQSPAGASFANNTTITLTETPNANSSFVKWGGVCPQTFVGPCTFVLNSSVAATATFAANVSLTTSVVGPGTITQSPTGTSFAPGSQVILTAVPNSGATFVSWTPSSPCFPGTPATECIVTLSANTTVTATFTGPPVSLSTVVVGPGSITQSPTGTSFATGTAITLTAVPNTGATFTSWSGGACSGSTNATCAFNISANTTVTATFAAIQYTLATTVSGPGSITQSPTGTSFASGTAITLTAVPNTGATFTSWSGGACSGGTSPTCAFNISANTSVTATFSSPPAVTTPTPSQSGGAGSSFTFPLSATGFSTAPTYTASCTIPAGSCTINGTTLVVTTTARNAAVRQTTAWIGPSNGTPNGRTDGNRAGGAGSTPKRGAIGAVAALLFAMLAGIMLGTGAGGRSAVRWRRSAPALATLVAFAGLGLLVACGGSSGGPTPTGTPAGTYNVSVTATAGTQSATTNVSVTVQ